jgi:predicted RNA binding protein YcfA (HicA-like mRNA interferase family)
MPLSSKDIIRMLLDDGWRQVDQSGSHAQFKHPAKPGKVTVPTPRKDMPLGTIVSIERQSRLKLRK